VFRAPPNSLLVFTFEIINSRSPMFVLVSAIIEEADSFMISVFSVVVGANVVVVARGTVGSTAPTVVGCFVEIALDVVF